MLEEEALTPDALKQELMKLKDQAPVMIDYMKNYKSEKARERVIEIIKTAGGAEIWIKIMTNKKLSLILRRQFFY